MPVLILHLFHNFDFKYPLICLSYKQIPSVTGILWFGQTDGISLTVEYGPTQLTSFGDFMV